MIDILYWKSFLASEIIVFPDPFLVLIHEWGIKCAVICLLSVVCTNTPESLPGQDCVVTSRLPLNRKLRGDTAIHWPCVVRWPMSSDPLSSVRCPAVLCQVSCCQAPVMQGWWAAVVWPWPAVTQIASLSVNRFWWRMENENMVRAGNIIFFTLLINFLPLFSLLVILYIFLVHPVEISHYVVLVSGSKWHNGVLVTCVCLLQTRRCEYDNGSRDSPHLPPHHASIWATSPHTSHSSASAPQLPFIVTIIPIWCVCCQHLKTW